MKQTRQYEDDETVKLGDVVRMFEGAYGTAVVTSIGNGVVVCERVHAGVGLGGQIQIGIERVTLSKERMRELSVFVTGPSGGIDNRHRRL